MIRVPSFTMAVILPLKPPVATISSHTELFCVRLGSPLIRKSGEEGSSSTSTVTGSEVQPVPRSVTTMVYSPGFNPVKVPGVASLTN